MSEQDLDEFEAWLEARMKTAAQRFHDQPYDCPVHAGAALTFGTVLREIQRRREEARDGE